MRQGSEDEFTSPLDEVLQDTPDEEPPADLKSRCLAALRAEDKETGQARPLLSVRALVATAAALTAGFVLVTGLLTLLPPGPEQARRASLTERVADTDVTALEADQVADGTEGVGDWVVRAAPAPTDAPSRGGATAHDRVATKRIEVPTEEPVRVEGGRAGTRLASTGSVDGGMEAGDAEDTGPTDDARVAVQRKLDAHVRTRPLSKYLGPVDAVELEQHMPDASAPTRPWRDESGERQKITRKEMELEVRDVEEAHRRATSVIEDGGGYVQTEELRIDQGDQNQAHLVARVPVANLSDVVSQLRELGNVLKLIGESDDRTKEYAARGAAIRELGAKECELVEKYEKEKNRYRKQQLYQQIMAIREQNRQAKQPLLELSDKTHLASLDLTMVEAGGPGRFLSEVFGNAGTAALWLAVSAIFWVPALLVITLVWHQFGKRRA